MLAIDWKSYECQRCRPYWKTPPCETQVEASRLVADHLATHGISMSPQIVDARGAEIGLLQRQRADLLRELKALQRWNCDCLPAVSDGDESVVPDGTAGVYRQRWVVLANELDALIRRYEA